MRTEKHHLTNYIGNLIADSDYVYFISFLGLSVKQANELRSGLNALGAELKVFKNSLINKAGELLKIDELAKLELTGGTAMVYGKGDPGAPAKVFVEFGKKIELVAPKAGYFEKALLSADEVKDIAALPSKAVLQAMLLGVLQGPSRNLAYLVNAYKEKLEQQ